MIILVVIMLFIVICLLACNSDNIYGWTVGLIVMIFLTLFFYVGFYESTRINVEKLYAQQNNILLNYKTLVLNMNKVAIVKQENDSIIIDLANMKQSTNTSQAFATWVSEANAYNLLLAGEKGKREMGFFGKLWYCWRVPLRNDIKYIEVKLN